MDISSAATAIWQTGTRQALSLFLSNHCPICERSTAVVLCDSCQRQLRRHQLSQPVEQTLSGMMVISWGAYEGSLKQSIATLKYNRQRELAQFLGYELGHVWLQVAPRSQAAQRPSVIIPIPLHHTRLQERGFNQAELLAKWFCHVTQLPLMPDSLWRVQATRPQHSLGRAERQQNLSQAFAVNPQRLDRLRRSTVWLLDDIFTTGATAEAAAQTLRRYRISVAGVCSIARAMPNETRHS